MHIWRAFQSRVDSGSGTPMLLVALIFISLFGSGLSWRSVSRGNSNTIYVDFDNYDFEVEARGHNAHFDIHWNFPGTSWGVGTEWNLRSDTRSIEWDIHSSYGSGCDGDGYFSNLPYPSSSTRIWRFSKDSSHFRIRCDGVEVAAIPRSRYSCISSYQWARLGTGSHMVFFNGDDSASQRYRVVRKCTVVHGGWSSWGSWSSCSCDHSTGTGTYTRTRSCNNPAPSCGGSSCSGSSSDTGRCDSQCCMTTNGGWTDWADWGSCSCDHSTGTGTYTRTRSCTNPAPSCGGSSCSGSSSDTGRCDSQCCMTTNGGWTDWADWGSCSCDHSTGTGTYTRTRSCTNPAPSCGGSSCSGSSSDTGSCDSQCCRTVHGGWTDWADWAGCDCDYNTGTATWTRTRTCTNPAPYCHGNSCTGESSQVDSCVEQCAPRHGGWTDYGDWTKCSAVCGGGTQTRTRTCTNPAPQFWGQSCSGEETDTRNCNPYPCDGFVTVDREGGIISDEREGLLLYGGGTVCDDDFSDNSANAICGELGENYRAVSWKSGYIYPTLQTSKTIALTEVECISGAWSSCVSTSSRIKCRHEEDIHLACELGTPVDGGWNDYGDWTECSAVCGGGTQTRTRTCTNPAPQFGGQSCSGEETERRSCNSYSCGAFTLIDENENPVTDESWEGLLVYGGGTVCDGNFSWNSANTICRELGFGAAAGWRSGVNWGSVQTDKPVNLDNVVCRGDGDWSACTFSEISNCEHEEDVFLTCQDFGLVGADGNFIIGQKEGLLLYKSGTVCDTGFTDQSAEVLCQKMGYHGMRSWRSGHVFGDVQSRYQVALGSVECNSDDWRTCEVSTTNTCGHDTDVILTCHDFEIVDGEGNVVTDEAEGLLLYKGGTVCDDHFTDNSAHAICREMGYHGVLSWRSGLVYGSLQNDKYIFLDEVRCSSNVWSDCSSTGFTDCRHSEDVHVSCELPTPKDGGWTDYGDWTKCSAVCGGGTQTRTRTCTNPAPRYGGADCAGEDRETQNCNPYPCEGFVIVNAEGQSIDADEEGLLLYGGGTVCDDNFSWNSANTICRELGFGAAAGWRSGVNWGSVQTDKPVNLDNVVCTSDGLWSSCRRSTLRNCVHNEDVFLKCQDFSLTNEAGHIITAHKTEGLLLHKDGTVNGKGFSDDAATAICREMGYHGAFSWRTGLQFGRQQSNREVSIGSVDCSVAEWSSCFTGNSTENNHEEDVLLSCEYAPDCVDSDGKGYQAGEGYPHTVNPHKICTCKADSSFDCACPEDNLVCSGGTSRWTDDDNCRSICIKDPGYCYSAGDPHYLTFDGKYYDFHGVCTYQAASCDDFTVYLKNVDLHGGAPRYTYRIELRFKGHEFIIGPSSSATVDGKAVQTPYVRKFSNGDKVEIIHNGQLEILLYQYSKNRNPAVRLKADDGRSYINAYIWLHGSCSGITEGLCGNWNGNSGDDLFRNDPNAHGEKFKQFDENCPAPPPPYDPCNAIGPNAKTQAEEICNRLIEDPFSACGNVVPVGDTKEGLFNTCMTDVCHCKLDETCACPQFDAYAQKCIENGVDLNDWREEVAFCPYDCPSGQVYKPNGTVPSPTCLEKNPTITGTVRGCFCPEGQYMQDGNCVRANQCKCLHEGVFYNNGDEIRDEGDCEVCTCEDEGVMNCVEMTCPDLNCEEDELVSYREDQCCPYCQSDWVEAMNPTISIKKGQYVTLSCVVHVKDVGMKNIAWYKGEDRILDQYQISPNRLSLVIKEAEANDRGTYTCEATKNGVKATADFRVSVFIPAVCTHEDGTEFEQGKIYNPNKNTACSCDARGRHSCSCIDDPTIQCSFPTAGVWHDEHCNKTCVQAPATCSSANDPHYRTFDGKSYDFHGRCTYQAASCDDFKVKLKNKNLGSTPTYTDKMILEFKGHNFAIHSAGFSAHVDGNKVQVPYSKKFANGDRVSIAKSASGQMVITLYSQNRDPSAELTARTMSGGKWINVAIKLHGSCASFSEGLCGVWNGNSADDLLNNSPNENGERFKDFDENCPPPPAPYRPCDNIGPQRKARALAICQILTQPPFSACNNVIPVGNEEGGFINTCMTEICQCNTDKSCACPEFDMYAEECINSGVDLSHWRDSVDFCPHECPAGEVYMAEGPVPAPSCLDRSPNKTGTARGCFCPEGTFLQDEQCVRADQCRCLHEGTFFSNGDEIRDEGDCEVCTCEDEGVMNCVEMTCPDLNCEGDELVSYREDQCCPYCQSDWVEAVNPKVEVKAGQSIELTCAVHAANINKKSINWYQDGKGIVKGISRDRLKLTIVDIKTDQTGRYTCEASRDGKFASGRFDVDVHAPVLQALVKDQCQDQNKWCRIWANKGFCHLKYMILFCKSSCSLCYQDEQP